VSGSFAALVIFLASVNDVLMERHFAGHNLVWWGACLGVLLAVSRAVIGEGTPVFDPEDAMAKVVRHTHFMPRHWRGRAHTREVQEQFEGLFCFKAILFVEELASVFLAPYVLGVSLARCSEAITSFIRDNSINVAGLGDVCSAAQFDLERHGSRRYGAPAASTRAHRSRQVKHRPPPPGRGEARERGVCLVQGRRLLPLPLLLLSLYGIVRCLPARSPCVV